MRTAQKEQAIDPPRSIAHEQASKAKAGFPAPLLTTGTGALLQRSSTEVVMPGLGNDDQKSGGKQKNQENQKKRKREDDSEQDQENELPDPKRRRKTRSYGKKFNLSRPRLRYSGNYQGVATQQLDARQNICFGQDATLIKPQHAPLSASTYYDFRQKVRDGYGSTPPSPGEHALGANFVQDGPFRPPYNDPNITTNPRQINFNDTPGFSGNVAIPEGDWLDWYEVRFQWEVKRQDTPSGTWTSPEVTHRVDAPYNGGNSVPVVHQSTPAATWDVDIP